jgi:hypothetical protein
LNPAHFFNYLAAGAETAGAVDFLTWLFFLWVLPFTVVFAGVAIGATVLVPCAKTKPEVETTNKATKAIENNFFMMNLLKFILAVKTLIKTRLAYRTAGLFKKLQLISTEKRTIRKMKNFKTNSNHKHQT